jgi:hypothetical protein
MCKIYIVENVCSHENICSPYFFLDIVEKVCSHYDSCPPDDCLSNSWPPPTSPLSSPVSGRGPPTRVRDDPRHGGGAQRRADRRRRDGKWSGGAGAAKRGEREAVQAADAERPGRTPSIACSTILGTFLRLLFHGCLSAYSHKSSLTITFATTSTPNLQGPCPSIPRPMSALQGSSCQCVIPPHPRLSPPAPAALSLTEPPADQGRPHPPVRD